MEQEVAAKRWLNPAWPYHMAVRPQLEDSEEHFLHPKTKLLQKVHYTDVYHHNYKVDSLPLSHTSTHAHFHTWLQPCHNYVYVAGAVSTRHAMSVV